MNRSVVYLIKSDANASILYIYFFMRRYRSCHAASLPAQGIPARQFVLKNNFVETYKIISITSRQHVCCVVEKKINLDKLV